MYHFCFFIMMYQSYGFSTISVGTFIIMHLKIKGTIISNLMMIRLHGLAYDWVSISLRHFLLLRFNFLVYKINKPIFLHQKSIHVIIFIHLLQICAIFIEVTRMIFCATIEYGRG
jgi:hypothetical protein